MEGRVFYTIEETSIVMDISVRRVRYLIFMFELEAFKIGYSTYIPIQSMKLYQKEKKETFRIKLALRNYLKKYEKSTEIVYG